jgi:hypothetical protein
MSFPDNFICPITQAIMYDPCIGDDGITYERTAIMQWLSSNTTSPVTRNYMSSRLIFIFVYVYNNYYFNLKIYF